MVASGDDPAVSGSSETPHPGRARWTRRARRPAAAVASGVLLALARPPADLGPLAFVALVPLLWVWADARPRAAAGYGALSGAVYYGLLVSWSWYFGAVAIIPFVGTLAAYWAAVGAAQAWLRGVRLRGPWVVAAVWVLGEAVMVRWPFGGFSWGEVGYAFHDLPVARSVASWGGVPLLSFLAVAAAAATAAGLRALHRRDRRSAWRAGAAVAAVVAVFAVGHLTRYHTTPTTPLRFALVQGNDRNRDLTDAEREARLLPRQHFALADSLTGHYDLVVFPESSMDADPRLDPWLAGQIAAVARRLDAHVLTNAVVDAPDGRAVNLNLLYGPDGRLEGTYAKRHLVPFGEFVPFRSLLEGWIGALDQVPRDFAPGDDPAIFDVDGHRVATVICFETAFGPLVRGLADQGADVIVVSTNNRSYRRSANAAQHLALSQMRAAETGRPVLHASINGITGVIDRHGDVIAESHLFVNEVVTGEVFGTIGKTPYVRFGEWVVVSCLVAVAVLVGLGLARRFRWLVDSDASRARMPA